MALDPRSVARALGGDATGLNIMAPGPGHSRADRSLSIKIDSTAQDGFILHSFAGDSPIACREYVRMAIGMSVREKKDKQSRPQRPRPSTALPDDNSTKNSAFALQLWNEAYHPQATIVVSHLVSRGLALPDDIAGDVLRFHPALRYNGAIVGAMVALFRDIRTDEPCGIHRTFFDSAGRKLDRRMLGRAKHAAIKLHADESVSHGLIIGEGIETGIAARMAGFRPVYALGSASAIAVFPVLAGIEAITILGEVGDGGANYRAAKACAARWIDAEHEAFLVAPLVGADLNDVWREAVR